ncbi:MAG: RNA methyltransferase [Thermoplasmatota archaeon]
MDRADIDSNDIGWKIVPILVEPKYGGNIGSIARCAMNFSLDELIMVNPPVIGDEAIAYSMHGRSLLDGATKVGSFDEARSLVDIVVGTSGISDSREKCHVRNPMTPDELIRWIRGFDGRVGLAFGREDFGLLNDELEKCDLLVTIPANPDYPILNLSHSACLLFYELFRIRSGDFRNNARSINGKEREVLMDHYRRLLAASRIPEHKIPISMIHFRRLMARASPNVREFYSLMGTLSRAMDYKRKKWDRSGKDEE